jgi:hypothetical protein
MYALSRMHCQGCTVKDALSRMHVELAEQNLPGGMVIITDE